MIEPVSFVLGFLYCLIGVAVESSFRDSVERHMKQAGVHSRLGHMYGSLMLVLLWPFLLALIGIATGYAALSEVGE